MLNLEALYEESELQNHLAASFRPLVEARKAGKVQHVAAHGSVFYSGQWVADWLADIGMVESERTLAQKKRDEDLRVSNARAKAQEAAAVDAKARAEADAKAQAQAQAQAEADAKAQAEADAKAVPKKAEPKKP